MCTVDPDRGHIFTSYHGDSEIQRMPTKKYYYNNLESDIKTVKTVNIKKFGLFLAYIFRHLGELFYYNASLRSNFKVLGCTNCRTLLWNRDVNATKNIWDICTSIWSGSWRPERSNSFFLYRYFERGVPIVLNGFTHLLCKEPMER
ncbi:hypothetical protein BD770DRAFT_411995 [Pilaira anomala]|nr:hypothetical protein BD770DRAFT_411995 [Pilaira anomala]